MLEAYHVNDSSVTHWLSSGLMESVWRACHSVNSPTLAHCHLRRPHWPLDGCRYPKDSKVAIENDDKIPRVPWQDSRPLKCFSYLTSVLMVMFVALGLEANLSHSQIEHLEKVWFPRTAPRGHIYLFITRIKISPATPTYKANEKLSYLTQLDYIDDL